MIYLDIDKFYFFWSNRVWFGQVPRTLFSHRRSLSIFCIYIFDIYRISETFVQLLLITVKPVYNDHLYDKMYYLWFIQ